ncbi:esterase/lipase family protein [Actinomycetes bacterium M1A6_2h]
MIRFVGLAAVVSIVSSVVYSAVAAAAPPADVSCDHAVVLVHDMGSNENQWRALASDLVGAGRCTFAFTYGANGVTAATGIAGLTAVEDSAVEFSSILDSVGERTGLDSVDVIAHGAGGLVTQYYLDTVDPARRAPRVASLTTLGPLWGGTDIAGLATVADTNKKLGIYEPLAALEAPLLAPVCPGCPQLIARSHLMTELDRLGYSSPAVRYTDIISLSDGLMSDPRSAAVHGARSIVLQNIDASVRTDHFGLPDDSLARSIAVDAVTPS